MDWKHNISFNCTSDEITLRQQHAVWPQENVMMEQ